MVKIKFLGACQEVGRSGVLIESEDTGDAVLCDYGTKMGSDDQTFPAHVSGKNLSAIVLTHAHIDHSGALPLFYISGSVPLYCTELTFKTAEILLSDMLNISRAFLPFERAEIAKMKRYSRFLNYGQRKKVGKNSWITLYNAGHIPGSAVILIEMDGKKILYTGDINTNETQLVEALKPDLIPSIDAVITETTYGTTDHAPRKEIEKKIIESVRQVVDGKGTALVPAFGVSRSQELLMVLNQEELKKSTITLDGMARKISILYEIFPDMIKNPALYKQTLKRTHFINQRKRDKERLQAISQTGIIVAPSGMLKGGTARYYMDALAFKEKNGVFLVSYQGENTPGRELLETGKYAPNTVDKSLPVKVVFDKFDFSSHSGMSDLIIFLNKLKFQSKEKNVYCVHGDKLVIDEFAENIKRLGFKVEIPVEGQTFTLT